MSIYGRRPRRDDNGVCGEYLGRSRRTRTVSRTRRRGGNRRHRQTFKARDGKAKYSHARRGGRTRTKTRSLPPPITDRLPWPFIRVSAAAEFTIEANVRGDGTVTFDSTGIFHSAYRKRYSNRPDNDGPVTGTRGGTLSRRTGGDRCVRISILCSAVTGAWRG